MKRFLILSVFAIATVGFAGADCDFKPEKLYGKADVVSVVRFTVPRKNKCFPNRGPQLGKIQFEYEYPEGSYQYYQYVGYYDAATQCYSNGNLINCAQVVEGAEIGDVRFVEKIRHSHSDPFARGVLNHLFVVQ